MSIQNDDLKNIQARAGRNVAVGRGGGAERKSSRKRLFIILACILLAVIGIGSCVRMMMPDKEAELYAEKIVAATSSWDWQKMRPHASMLLFEQVPEPQCRGAFQLFSRLGPLKSHEKPEFAGVFSGVSSSLGTYKVRTYTVEAVYENGDALLTIALLKNDGEYRLISLNVNSDSFFLPAENAEADAGKDAEQPPPEVDKEQ